MGEFGRFFVSWLLGGGLWVRVHFFILGLFGGDSVGSVVRFRLWGGEGIGGMFWVVRGVFRVREDELS